MLTELPPAFLLTASFALGACVGSFLNVVVYRLPHGESIIHPGSRCPACQDAIPAWANVPILSWLYLRGRCRRCKSPISIRYPLVETATATLFALLMLRWLEVGPGPRLLVDWLLASSLVAVSLIDADHRIIPNEITYPGIPLGIVLAWLAPGPTVVDALLGLVIPGGMLWGLSAAYEHWRGQIGLGMGDVKLIAMLGAFLGLAPALEIIVLGSLLGLAWGLFLIAFRGAGRLTRIPFGPALACAALFQLFAPGWVMRSLAGLAIV
jgi:leader peptidase (prepilin peptidase)/N-methyltransferase